MNSEGKFDPGMAQESARQQSSLILDFVSKLKAKKPEPVVEAEPEPKVVRFEECERE